MTRRQGLYVVGRHDVEQADDLAARSGVFANTIKNFENGTSDPKRSTLLKWRRALEKGGVIFIDADAEAGPGVRLRDERK